MPDLNAVKNKQDIKQKVGRSTQFKLVLPEMLNTHSKRLQKNQRRNHDGEEENKGRFLQHRMRQADG